MMLGIFQNFNKGCQHVKTA